jgi:prepilin-type N-terminal cleavage/methylation domain-containing protein
LPVIGAGPRRGLTLIELMVALGLGVSVSGAIYRLLLATQRAEQAQVERAALQDNVRAGALVVTLALAELGFDSVPAAAGLGAAPAASSDILLGQPGLIRYRAMRGLGFTCAVASAGGVNLRAASYEGLRAPAAGVDSVAIFVDGDPATPDDDAWVRAGLTAVANGTCADGTPAIALSTGWADPALGSAASARMIAGGPVRLFEVMELRYYRAEGKSWLGMRSVSRGEVIQPVVGPLADSSAALRGLTLAYLDRSDAPTALMTEVRSITLAILGVTALAVRPDSFAFATRVTLRNTLRP